MRLTINGKTTPLREGWTRVSEHTGAQLFNDGTVEYINCGGVEFVDGIQLDDGPTIFGLRVPIRSRRWKRGNGKECVAPRAGYIFRTQNPQGRVPASFMVGGRSTRWASDLRIFNAAPFVGTQVGMWTVAGEKQANASGEVGIEPFAGCEQDPLWLISRADAHMSRTPLLWLDMDSGEPIESIGQEYNGARSWSKSTQIADVCEKISSDPNDDRRFPIFTDGFNGCPYWYEACGINPYDSWGPPDDQHRIRTDSLVDAAANCGDPCHIFNRRMLARDAFYSRPVVIEGGEARGSTYYGTRAVAWSMLAWLRGGLRAHAELHAAQMMRAQMSNGCFMNAKYGDIDFAPNPWDKGWIPTSSKVAAQLEHFITVLVLCALGMKSTARKAMAGVFDRPFVAALGYVPKFFVVEKFGVIEGVISETCGEPGYEPWMALGAYAALCPEDVDSWSRWACSIATPSQGKATLPAGISPDAPWSQKRDPMLRDLRERLRREMNDLGRGVCIPLYSVLKGMPL